MCGASEQAPGEKYRIGLICMEVQKASQSWVVMAKVESARQAECAAKRHGDAACPLRATGCTKPLRGVETQLVNS
jgi:hypothetical protein